MGPCARHGPWECWRTGSCHLGRLPVERICDEGCGFRLPGVTPGVTSGDRCPFEPVCERVYSAQPIPRHRHCRRQPFRWVGRTSTSFEPARAQHGPSEKVASDDLHHLAAPAAPHLSRKTRETFDRWGWTSLLGQGPHRKEKFFADYHSHKKELIYLIMTAVISKDVLSLR